VWILKTGTGVFFARRWEPVVNSPLSPDDTRAHLTNEHPARPRSFDRLYRGDRYCERLKTK
jgi:hypothetical protein